MLSDDALDGAGVVAVDVLCQSCRYNLRGLTRQSKCPECGTPAYASLSGWMLCFAPPGWVARVGFGATMCGVGTAMLLIAPLPVLLAPGELAMWLLPLLSAVGHLIGSAGAFILATPEPSIRPASLADVPSRSQTRALMFLFNLMLISGIAFCLVPMPVPLFGGLLLSIDCFVLLAWLLIELDYADDLARRLANATLARTARVSQVGAVLAALIFPIELCMGALAPSNGPVARISILAGFVVLLALATPFVVTMLWLSRCLKHESCSAARLRREIVATANPGQPLP
jgi:hypothetical protein